MICIQVAAIILAMWVTWKLLKHRPNPLHGHYTQKESFHAIKKFLAVLYLRYLRKSTQLFSIRREDVTNFAIVSSEHEELLEKPRQKAENAAVDSVLITGVDSKGRNALLVRFDRRPDRKAGIWLYLKLASDRLYQLPIHPDTQVYNTNGRTFSAAGLTLEVLEPLRRWRVTFNGVLRQGIRTTYAEDEVDTVHVKFNFIWTPVHALIDDVHRFNAELMADAIATEKWTPKFFKRLQLQENDCYHQWGHLNGTVTIGNLKETIVCLRGIKTRVCGAQSRRHTHRYANFLLYCNDGTVIRLTADSKKPFLTHVLSGHVISCSSCHEEIRQSNLSLPHFAENEENIPSKICIDLKTATRSYRLHVTIDPNGFVVYEGDDWGFKVYVRTIRADVNGIDATGTLELGYRSTDGCPLPRRQSTPFLEESTRPTESSLYTLPLSDIRCTNTQLVGGKGMSLALVTTSLKGGDFAVPNGFCITVAAYWLHLEQNPKISNAIGALQDVAWKTVTGDLQEECRRTVETVTKALLSDDLKQAIEKELIQVFGQRSANVRLAVRSSAIGEDGEEMSAAGQNETFLGVKGVSELWTAVAKCWASQFSFIAVEYKRCQCQPINGGMGVVVQEMVPAEVAGVLFTVDPLTGCPNKIVITANYGLGESVMSAISDPDTIHLKRTWYDRIEIQSKQLGRKEVKITLNDDGGTVTEELSEEANTTCCLSDESALRLGHIGLLLEWAFGSPRDIEFAIHQEQIYLLQSRAITSFVREDDYEIVHELDDANITENEFLTKGNVGEVFPGATTPLTLSVLPFIINCCIEQNQPYSKSYQFRAHKILHTRYNQLFFAFELLFVVGVEETLSIFEDVMPISVFGRPVIDDSLHRKLLHRFGTRSIKKVTLAVLPFVKFLFVPFHDITKCKEYCDDCRVTIEDSDSAIQIFDKICEKNTALAKCVSVHISATRLSSVGSSMLIYMLTSGAKEVLPSHTSDMAHLLGACGDVISATVPAALRDIADAIRCSEHAQQFFTMTTEDAVSWLMNDTSQIGQMFQQFLLDHGHRCIKEFEIAAVPWGEDPTVVVETLQTSVKSKRNPTTGNNRQPLSVAEAVEKIETPLSKPIKQILRWILPTIRETIGLREKGKSTCIKGIDRLREAYRRLATKMVSEGRLPDPQLIYFFTFWELGQLLRTRSTRLLAKAERRRHMQPKLEAMRFPEFNSSVPQPIESSFKTSEEASRKRTTNLVLKATGASEGIVEGTACVIANISDANQIRAGDILITNTTDIGWSPYFPLLSGIVTEMGGIISHGAVVAREFGLPCLIAAKDATKLFKSGDRVLLNSFKGTLELLLEDDSNL